MTQAILQTAVLLLFPAAAIHGAKRSRLLGWFSPVLLCYGFGILLANLPGLPLDLDLSTSLTQLTVVLAIPLLLFSTDLGAWLRLAPKTILSFGLGGLAVLASTALGAWLFRERVAEYAQIAGMLIGVYTGGTANMSAIGMALEVNQDTFIVLNAADVAISSVYLFFLMTIAQRVFLLVLPPFRSTGEGGDGPAPPDEIGLPELLRRGRFRGPAVGLVLSAAVVGAAVGLSFLVRGSVSVALVVLAITTLGLAASFFEGVRTLEGSYDLGQYILLVFCVSIGTMANVKNLIAATGPILVITFIAIFGAVLLHVALAALFRIDTDTVIITSTAAVFSPAFVGPIAGVLGNREVVVSGITTGVIGYAVGNYLGLLVAYLLMPA